MLEVLIGTVKNPCGAYVPSGMLRDGSAAILEPRSRGIIELNTEQICLETISIRRGMVIDVNVGRN